jgi:hypothetical protein
MTVERRSGADERTAAVRSAGETRGRRPEDRGRGTGALVVPLWERQRHGTGARG